MITAHCIGIQELERTNFSSADDVYAFFDALVQANICVEEQNNANDCPYSYSAPQYSGTCAYRVIEKLIRYKLKDNFINFNLLIYDTYLSEVVNLLASGTVEI